MNAHDDDQRYFNDFLGAMTKNQIGRGHSDEYYARDPGHQIKEMFANYVCLTQGKGGDVYRQILHSIAPECCKGFDTILADRAKAGRASAALRKKLGN